MKKFLTFFVTLIFCIFLTSCEFPNKDNVTSVRLPDLTGMTRSEIEEKMDSLNLRFSFGFKHIEYYGSSMYDQFVEYGNGFEAGDRVDINTFLYIFTTALPLPSENIVDLKMDFDYEGKTFLEDGIEKVTLARSIDGDTAHFYTTDGSYIKVRFLGIDTPESTMEHEAWGEAASNFTKNLLENAETIVIEAEGNMTDTYGRYLAFVWADGVLVNLEVVQNGYSNCKLSSSSKYFDALYETELAISKTGRRVWGEIDPDYDYERREFK